MSTITLTHDTEGVSRAMNPETVTAGVYDRIPDWDADGYLCIDTNTEDGLHPLWLDEQDDAIEEPR